MRNLITSRKDWLIEMGLAWFLGAEKISPRDYFRYDLNKKIVEPNLISPDEIEQMEKGVLERSTSHAGSIAALIEAQETQKDAIMYNIHLLVQQSFSKKLHAPNLENVLPAEILKLAERIVDVTCDLKKRK